MKGICRIFQNLKDIPDSYVNMNMQIPPKRILQR